MAEKKLTPEDVERMIQGRVSGKTPNELKEEFGIAISSVHNYLGKAKKENPRLVYPNVKGKTSQGKLPGTIQSYKQPGTVKAPGIVESKVGTATGINHSVQQKVNTQAHLIKFEVNGVKVNIATSAKEVTVGKDIIKINF